MPAGAEQHAPEGLFPPRLEAGEHPDSKQCGEAVRLRPGQGDKVVYNYVKQLSF